MNTLDAVVTRVLDVRPYRHFWIVEVEVLSWGRYSNTTIIRDSEKEARQVQPGDTVTISGSANERRNQLPPVLAKPCDLLCTLLAVVLDPDGLSRLSCWLYGLGCAVVSYKNVVKSKEKTKWLCTKRSINSKEMS